MRVLALDTSTDFLSLACLEDGILAGEVHEYAGMKHSSVLVMKIKSMLEGLNWGIKDIALVAAGIGPGSFTGLRIGVSTVKGIALVSGIPVAGIPTLDAVAMRAPSVEGLIVPVLDAHKGKVYTCVYEKHSDGKLNKITDYLLCDIGTLGSYVKKEALFFGSGIEKYGESIKKWPMARMSENLDWFPRASDIGRMAFELPPSGTVSPDSLEPLYLYPKECNVLRSGN